MTITTAGVPSGRHVASSSVDDLPPSAVTIASDIYTHMNVDIRPKVGTAGRACLPVATIASLTLLRWRAKHWPYIQDPGSWEDPRCTLHRLMRTLPCRLRGDAPPLRSLAIGPTAKAILPRRQTAARIRSRTGCSTKSAHDLRRLRSAKLAPSQPSRSSRRYCPCFQPHPNPRMMRAERALSR